MESKPVEIKSKGQLLETADYTYPESLEEALEVDGEEKVFKLYMQQRIIRFRDARRNALTGGGIPKEYMDAIKAAGPEKIKELLASLGVEIDGDGSPETVMNEADGIPEAAQD